MKHFLPAIFLLFTSGCVSTTISSNKSPELQGGISRLYILIQGTDTSKAFFKTFSSNLTLYLDKEKVLWDFHYEEPASLNTKEDLLPAIHDFAPDLVMKIEVGDTRQSSRYIGLGPGFVQSSGATFDIQLSPVNSDKPLWRASLNTDSPMGLESTAKKASKVLIAKLKQDKLF